MACQVAEVDVHLRGFLPRMASHPDKVLPYLSQEEQLQGSEVYVVCDIIRLTTV